MDATYELWGFSLGWLHFCPVMALEPVVVAQERIAEELAHTVLGVEEDVAPELDAVAKAEVAGLARVRQRQVMWLAG